MEKALQELWEIRINRSSIRYPRLSSLNATHVLSVETLPPSQTFRKSVAVGSYSLSSQGPVLIFLLRSIESSIIHMLWRKLFIQSSLGCSKGWLLSLISIALTIVPEWG